MNRSEELSAQLIELAHQLATCIGQARLWFIVALHSECARRYCNEPQCLVYVITQHDCLFCHAAVGYLIGGPQPFERQSTKLMEYSDKCMITRFTF